MEEYTIGFIILGDIRTSILSGTDLNNLKTVGVYMCNSGTVAASLLNKPTSVSQAFRLQVLPLPNVGADYAEQTLYELSNGGVYRRICVGNNGWNAWQKFTITAV